MPDTGPRLTPFQASIVKALPQNPQTGLSFFYLEKSLKLNPVSRGNLAKALRNMERRGLIRRDPEGRIFRIIEGG